MTEPAPDAAAAVLRAFRSDYGRTVAILMRALGDLDLAEDAVQDAYAAAAERWPVDGVPPNPQAWIVTTARRRAIDRARREQTAARFAPQLVKGPVLQPQGAHDDELRMILLCAHPSLSPESQVALTLRLAGGLTTAEIARALGASESSTAQRLSRAKAKIRDARIGLPEPGHVRERIEVVLTVIYAIYNEGYVATSGELTRFDLCQEAVRLARVVHRHVPDDPEAKGLLALLLLLQARRPVRTDADGSLVPLPEQDRGDWTADLVVEGQHLVRETLETNRPGPFQVQAAIQAVHCDAPRAEDTDWRQVLALYDMLVTMQPTHAVRVARTVAVSHVHGPEEALAETDAGSGDHYELAVRGDLLARLGRCDEASATFRRAAALTANRAERRHLERRATLADET